MLGGKGPSNAFWLKFKWSKLVDKYRIWGGIEPERLRCERSSEMICDLLSHLIPDHEHQDGFSAGCHSWRVERGSLREDFRERRETSCRGSVAQEVWENLRKKEYVRKMRIGGGFMVMGLWGFETSKR